MICYTTELLENVLLNLDNRTLLLSQRTNKNFRNVINTSLKLQKKLFFIQPTIEDARSNGLIQEWTEIFSAYAGDIALFNPLTFQIAVPSEDPKPYPRREALVSDTIILEMRSLRPGSWERMFCQTKMLHEDVNCFHCEFSVVINHWMVVNPNAKIKADEYSFEFEDVGGWGTNPLRNVMKKVEAEALKDCGIRFDWAATDLRIRGLPMTFGVWDKMCRLAQREGITDWSDLSLWKGYAPFPPAGDVIDDALSANDAITGNAS